MASSFAVRAPRSAEFPVDMLRYDRCWPSDTDSVSAIYRSLAGDGFDIGIDKINGITDLTVNLYTDDASFGPTVARWASFGWTVISAE